MRTRPGAGGNDEDDPQLAVMYNDFIALLVLAMQARIREIDTINSRLDRQNKTLALHNETLASYNATLASHNETFASHNETLASHNETLASYNETFALHSALFAHHGARLNENDFFRNRIRKQASSFGEGEGLPSERTEREGSDRVMRIVKNVLEDGEFLRGILVIVEQELNLRAVETTQESSSSRDLRAVETTEEKQQEPSSS